MAMSSNRFAFSELRERIACLEGGCARRREKAVLDILPTPDIGPFRKEDGEVVITADGKRVA